MELCLLLLTATAVGVASSGSSSGGGSGSGSSSGSGSAGGGLFPNLQCDPPTRRGRRLGQPKTVQIPSGCRKPSNGRGAALCDEPGDDYPWAAINNYLSKSSDFVKKRVENTLKASRISAPNTLRRRRTRSTDDVITIDDVRRDDVVTAVITGEKIRAKKHVDPPSARQRVTVVKATRLSPPLDDDEPALEDLSELVYASGAQRQAPEAEVVPPTARTTPLPPTTRPTPDPYTQPACTFRKELRSPFHAMNTNNEYKTLINLPNYETYIHMELCLNETSQGRCAEGCRCTQKYTIRNMPVYDTDDNGCDIIYMDKFLIASHCDCTCLPPGYTLFRKPPLPTTPLPEVVDLVGPLPEGILTERPTGARRGQVAKEEVTEVEEVVEEIEVKEKREGDTEEEEVDVEVVEVVEYVQEDKKAEDKALPSSGRPDKLKSESRPAVSGERQTASQQPLSDVTQRVKPARAPLPPAIRRHVTVRPRPRRPTAGPQLPDDSPPTHLWKALTRRQTRPSPRNHLRGPPTAPPGLRRR